MSTEAHPQTHKIITCEAIITTNLLNKAPFPSSNPHLRPILPIMAANLLKVYRSGKKASAFAGGTAISCNFIASCEATPGLATTQACGVKSPLDIIFSYPSCFIYVML